MRRSTFPNGEMCFLYVKTVDIMSDTTYYERRIDGKVYSRFLFYRKWKAAGKRFFNVPQSQNDSKILKDNRIVGK